MLPDEFWYVTCATALAAVAAARARLENFITVSGKGNGKMRIVYRYKRSLHKAKSIYDRRRCLRRRQDFTPEEDGKKR